MNTALAPGYVKVTETGSLFPHHKVIPINFDPVPTPGADFDVILKDASNQPVDDAIAALYALIAPFYPSTWHAGLAEAHAVDPTTGLDTFLWGWNVGVAGTGSGAIVQMQQHVMTFKLINGRLYRLYLMETVEPVNVSVFPPFSAGSIKDLSDFIVSDSSPIYGRGNSYPFSPIQSQTKFNDALRKQHGFT